MCAEFECKTSVITLDILFFLFIWYGQGYYRIRQTATDLRKKKEDEREARRRDRDTGENPLETDGKPKNEDVIMENSKDLEKVISATCAENPRNAKKGF